MKKIPLDLLRARSARAHRVHEKKLCRKGRTYKVVSYRHRIVPPSAFNLSENYDETVACLRDLKIAASKRSSHRERHIVHVDFTPIRSISLAGAVVLAAEIDRWRHLKRTTPRPIELERWDVEVKRRLWSLGFFELLGVNYVHDRDEGYDTDNVTLLPLISGQTLDREQLFTLLNEIMQHVAKALVQDPRVYGALTEAVYNSITHAYPEYEECEFPPLNNGWWATAGWSPQLNAIKFWVYDQGVGIPRTLPRSRYWEPARALLAKMPVIGEAVSDSSRLIRAALEVDRTSLSGGHGKGLQDVIAPVKDIKDAKVRILSGTGSIIHSNGKTTVNPDRSLHVGGTLIEWTIPIVDASRK